VAASPAAYVLDSFAVLAYLEGGLDVLNATRRRKPTGSI